MTHERQSGFRRNHSCTTALLNISESIKSAIYRKNPHSALLKVCESYGFDINALKLIESIYSNISQRVKVGSSESDSIAIDNGILQGTNFGQSFFSIYFNDTLTVPEHMTGHLFADDFQAHLEIDLDQINDGMVIDFW